MRWRGLGAAVLGALVVSGCSSPAPPPPPPTTAIVPVGFSADLATVDRVVIIKHQRRMMLYSNGRLLREYQVALGKNPLGHKQREGDGRTPEGIYTIDFRKPDSSFHRALRISYPNSRDIARAKAKGVAPGGAIMIHGLPNGKGWIGERHRALDWTDGCVAVTNEEIEEIWRAVPVGTPVEIRS